MAIKAGRLVARLVLGLGLVTGLGSTANAGDYSGDFMARVGASVVAPDSSADVFVGGVQVPAFDAEVSTEVIPSATLTYFFTNNLAVELFCCFAKHDVDGKGLLTGVDLGDTWIFPPALTLQYHFDSMNGFKPYVGAGVQYIAFFNEGSSQLGGATIDIDNAIGFTLQAGVDMEIGNGMYLNADVKKTWLDTEATWRGTAPAVTADVDLDPWIFSVGLGYRFNLFGPRYAETDTYK